MVASCNNCCTMHNVHCTPAQRAIATLSPFRMIAVEGSRLDQSADRVSGAMTRGFPTSRYITHLSTSLACTKGCLSFLEREKTGFEISSCFLHIWNLELIVRYPPQIHPPHHLWKRTSTTMDIHHTMCKIWHPSTKNAYFATYFNSRQNSVNSLGKNQVAENSFIYRI